MLETFYKFENSQWVQDPAFPGFSTIDDSDKNLDPSDAEFVDVIHTCSGILGHNENLGHVDFYPNKGVSSQPGCPLSNDFHGGCSHRKSYRYFAESILSKYAFIGIKCDSWYDYKYEQDRCHGDAIPMGDSTPTSARGMYYLQTSS